MTRERRNYIRDDWHEKREAIIAALTRATGDGQPLPAEPDEAAGDGNHYYTLNHEEIEALISGNLARIETWVSGLDHRHATWLLRRLNKENG